MARDPADDRRADGVAERVDDQDVYRESRRAHPGRGRVVEAGVARAGVRWGGEWPGGGGGEGHRGAPSTQKGGVAGTGGGGPTSGKYGGKKTPTPPIAKVIAVIAAVFSTYERMCTSFR